jgi:hypothetical protein
VGRTRSEAALARRSYQEGKKVQDFLIDNWREAKAEGKARKAQLKELTRLAICSLRHGLIIRHHCNQSSGTPGVLDVLRLKISSNVALWHV